MRVGVEKSGLPVQLLKEEPLVIAEIIPDFERGFKLLLSGKIDAVIVDRWVGAYILAQRGIKGIRILEKPVV
jgi:ABC-type amino acid transport substrate-binding protein